MTDVERDPLVRRAIDELRKTPLTDRAAVARVVAAAAAARIAPADDEVTVHVARPRNKRWWTVGGIAAAAAIVGFALSSARRPATPVVAATAAVAPSAGSELQLVASNPADAVPIIKQFVFHSRSARSVSVVGDFNQWNAESTRMTRAADGDLWSVTLPIVPGRHMYAFMVDDSVFVLDPREATSRDADLGVEASVTIVGRP